MMKGIVSLSSISCKGVGWVVVQRDGVGWKLEEQIWRGSRVYKATLDVIYNLFE
jgi:hypothetical protein